MREGNREGQKGGLFSTRWSHKYFPVKRICGQDHSLERTESCWVLDAGHVGKGLRWGMLRWSRNAALILQNLTRIWFLTSPCPSSIFLAFLPSQPFLSTATCHILNPTLLFSVVWKFPLMQTPPSLDWITDIARVLDSQFCLLPIFSRHVPTLEYLHMLVP